MVPHIKEQNTLCIFVICEEKNWEILNFDTHATVIKLYLFYLCSKDGITVNFEIIILSQIHKFLLNVIYPSLSTVLVSDHKMTMRKFQLTKDINEMTNRPSSLKSDDKSHRT